jgi:hypothetical protein
MELAQRSTGPRPAVMPPGAAASGLAAAGKGLGESKLVEQLPC